LPGQIVSQILEQLKADRLVEILGMAGPHDYRYAITARGRERAVRLLEISGYVGPTPVTLEAYSAALSWQLARLPEVSSARVNAALSALVLPADAVQVAGLARASGRSLFIYGPPGNGKTTLAHLLHNALEGRLWIPHCIGVDSSVIRLYDPRCHERAPIELPGDLARRVDRRWVCIQRPFVVVAGEMTIHTMELAYSRGRGYYEAPLHVKANGGTFLLDDFGRQRIEPRLILNRWTFPLEHGIDYLTLETGQQISVPFQQMLVVCTNLDPNTVMDAAFLRRIGYRLLLDDPTPESYAEIFRQYAARCDAAAPPSVLESLLDRYRVEKRPLRSCEPRDLIERARDICHYRGQPLELNEGILQLAWRGYFGGSTRSSKGTVSS
jgi:predicted ATPase with chaperone activity